MAAAKDKAPESVLVPFAYATKKDGEVVQLVKGNEVNSDLYTKESLEHLRSIGFVGSQD